MGRPRHDASAESMRDRIVHAAEKIVRDNGLARATTRDIAEAVPCSEGTLYRHFKSKEEIFLAVLSERLPALLPALRTLDSRVGRRTVRANLEQVALAALAFYDESFPMFASVYAEPRLLAQHSAWMRETNTGPHRAVEFVADYLRREQELGRVRADARPDEAAAMLLGACFLRSFARLSSPARPTADRRFVRGVVADLLLGLGPESAEPSGSAEDADPQPPEPGSGA